jgi:hypothetical protein
MPRAVITGVAGALPDYILTNEELSRMVIGRMVIRFYDEFFIGASRKLLQQ